MLLPTDSIARCARIVAVALLLSALTGCPSGPGQRPDSVDAATAERYSARGQHADAAQIYERLARVAPAAQRDALYLDASRQWLQAGQAPRALTNLERVRSALPKNDHAVTLLLGYRYLRDGSPQQSLDHLARMRATLPQRYLGLWYELRGRAYFQQGDAARGVAALVERELWLTRGEDIQNNRELIWRALGALAQKGAPLQPLPQSDVTTAGWLALANASGASQTDYFTGAQALRDWLDAHPTHPGGFVVERLLEQSPDALDYPGAVALLLPLGGRFAGTAAAVRDGFLAAYLQDSARPNRPVVRIYDTADNRAPDALQAALSDGAQFIVGPLLKDAVEAIAASPIDAGVMTLNTLPDTAPGRPNFFQFSLAPEHEATAVARRAVEEGLSRAVALVPNSDWGERVLMAFDAELSSMGGRLLAHRAYETSDNDFATPITEVLNINESRARHRQVAATVGMTLEFVPRRRQDVEFVFVAADARQGRLIRPAFQYYYAEDLPLFATSAIYEDDQRANGRDLNGVTFADIPWVISPDMPMQSVQNSLGQYWPSRLSRRARLYAMGYDAYRLIPRLMGDTPLAEPWAGATGQLVLASDGRIVRRLGVAQIRDGIAQPLGPVYELDAPVDELDGADAGTVPEE